MATELYGKELKFITLRGAASGIRESSRTTYGERYSVLYSGSVMASRESEETSFWLKHDNGQESQVTYGARVPMREGHDVLVIYVGQEGEKLCYPIAVYNRTTGQLFRHTPLAVCKRFTPPHQGLWGCAGALLAIACFAAPLLAGIANAGPWIMLVAFLVPLLSTIYLIVGSILDSRRILKRVRASVDAEIRKAAGFGDTIPQGVAIREIQ
jgi:hypothetical protein